MVNKLIAQSEDVIVLDDLSSGNRDYVDHRAVFIKGDSSDKEVLSLVFDSFSIYAVYLFTSCGPAGATEAEAKDYYNKQIACPLAILGQMKDHHIQSFHYCLSPLNVEKSEIHECEKTEELIVQIITAYCESYGISLEWINQEKLSLSSISIMG